jgi:hypothetical protein
MPKKLIISSILITIILFSSCKVWALGPITPPPYQQQPPGDQQQPSGGGEGGGGEGTIWDFLNQICGSCGINIICWFECILGYISTLFFRLPLFFFALLGIALAALLILIGDKVIVPIVAQLMDLSLTTHLYDDVKGFWESVRNFSLELVGIFLAIVGLATIFRFIPYHARRFFVSLCVAAILVNFSFAICKELILVANDFTATIGNYFKVGIITAQVGGVESEVKSSLEDFENVFDTLWKSLFEQFFPNIWKIFIIDGSIPAFFTTAESLGQPKVTGPILIIIALIATSFWIFAFLCLYVIIVLAAFGVVFLIRMVFLVALIAVAPIAFLTAGFATREIKQIFPQFLNWEGWWPAFLEWAFIGVPLIIWLGVGVHLLERLSSQPSFVVSSGGAPPNVGAAMTWASSLILDLFRPFLAVLAFAVALHLGIKSSPGMMRQAVEGIFGVLKLVTGAVAVAVTAAFTAGVGAAAGAAAAGASKLGAIGAGLKAGTLEGGRAFVGSLAKGVPGLKAIPEELRPGIETVEALTKRVPWVRRPLIYEKKEAEEEVEKTLKEKGPRGVLEMAESKIVGPVARRAAIQKAMEERFDRGEEWVKDKEMRRLILQSYEEAAKKGDKKTMAMIERRLVKSLMEDSELQESFKKIATKHKMYDEAKEGPFVERIIKRAKSIDDLKQLQGKWWENTAIREMAERFWTGAQWGAAAREFGKELVDALEPLINQLKTFKQTNDVRGYLHFVWDRPGLARYSATGAAQELGFPSWYELAPDGVRRRYRNMREILADKP